MNHYFPINSQNLAEYWASALIAPAFYIRNREKDAQSTYIYHLLFISKPSTENANCYLEIVLTDEEKASLISLSPDCFILDKPLPVTRIKQILFTDSLQKKQTITNITLSTAFIPDRLVDILQKSNEPVVIPEDKNTEIKPSHKDWKNDIKKFDGLMGAFALLRIGRTDARTEYSESFFALLSTYNSIISEQALKAGIMPKNNFSGNYHELLRKTILNEVTFDTVKESAKQERQSIQRHSLTGFIETNQLKDATYILAIIYSYGAEAEVRNLKIDDLILTNFRRKNHEDQSEELAFYYGYNKGYRIFAKNYYLRYKNEKVKFDFESLLDYYIIETIYQKTINNVNISGEFTYLLQTAPSGMPYQIATNDSYVICGKKILYTGIATEEERVEETIEQIKEKINKHFKTTLSTRWWKISPEQLIEKALDEFRIHLAKYQEKKNEEKKNLKENPYQAARDIINKQTQESINAPSILVEDKSIGQLQDNPDMISTEKVRQLLSPLDAKQLKKIAIKLNLPVSTKLKREELVEKILQASIQERSLFH